MIRNRKEHCSASVTQSVVAGRRPKECMVEDAVKLVGVSFLHQKVCFVHIVIIC